MEIEEEVEEKKCARVGASRVLFGRGVYCALPPGRTGAPLVRITERQNIKGSKRRTRWWWFALATAPTGDPLVQLTSVAEGSDFEALGERLCSVVQISPALEYSESDGAENAWSKSPNQCWFPKGALPGTTTWEMVNTFKADLIY